MKTRGTGTGYRVLRENFPAPAGWAALAFGALMLGTPSAFAQDRSIDPSATAASLKGSIGQRFTLTCPAISRAQNSIYGTDVYTADSPICQAALHAGALRTDQPGSVTIEISEGARQYQGSTRNGVTTRSYGPYPSAFRFVVPGMVAPLGSGTTPQAASADFSAAPAPAAAAVGAASVAPPPPSAPTATAASNATPPSSTALSSNAATQMEEIAVAKKLLAAVAKAIDMWKPQVQITGKVNGPTVIITPGGLTGPPLAPLIRMNLVGQGVAPETGDKFANVMGTAWQQWQASFAVTWPAYPAFAAWPGPEAPPTPNAPFPVAMGYAGNALSASTLRNTLLLQFPNATAPQKQAIEAFATAAASNFDIWRNTTQVRNLVGSGPVPAFAPPFVTAGQVVGGTAKLLPGGLTGPGFLTADIP